MRQDFVLLYQNLRQYLCSCTSLANLAEASHALVADAERAQIQNAQRAVGCEAFLRQDLYFCTSKTRKVSTREALR